MACPVSAACSATAEVVTFPLVKAYIVGILQKRNRPPTNITPDESQALRSLRKDESVVILPAHKGRSTVVMDKSNYEKKKAVDLLSDVNTYRYIDLLVLLILTPLVSVIFYSSIRTFCSFLKCFSFLYNHRVYRLYK